MSTTARETSTKLQWGKGWTFDTCARAGGLNNTGNSGWPDGSRLHITKFSQIINPSDKYVFVEEGMKYAGGHAGANLGPWALNPETKQWIDPVVVWHNDASTFSFADGHTQRAIGGWKWRPSRRQEGILN